MTTALPIEVELDSRQRLPRARVVKVSQHRFRVVPLPGGDDLVSPVVSVLFDETGLAR
jgi:hypothetical protein